MKEIGRLIIALLVFVFSSSLFIEIAHAKSVEFSDVAKNHPNYKAIHYMQTEGFIAGYVDGTFRPKELIARKHVAKLLEQALKLPQPTDAKVQYVDVPKNHPYYDAIMKLTAAGIFSGGTTGKFNPNAPITRIQMAKVLDLAFELHMTRQNSFFDVETDHWGYAHANAMYASGVSTGFKGHFNPNQPVTRAHYAEFLQRAIGVKNARPKTDKVTNGKAWDLSNRLPYMIERTLREGQIAKKSFEELRPELYKYATKEFTDAKLKNLYATACKGCYAPLFPYLRMEPLVRLQFDQPDTNSVAVQTIEFRNGITPGGFVDYTFKKQNGEWKIATSNYKLVGEKNFQLTIDEAIIAIKEDYLSLGYTDVVVKFVKKEDDIELDPVTDKRYPIIVYTFNVDTDYGRHKVFFNSSDGYSYQ